jgi:hypothetical protein
LEIMSHMLSHKLLSTLSGLAIGATAAQNAWAAPVSAVPPNAVHAPEMNLFMIAIEGAGIVTVIALVTFKRRRSEPTASVKP